MSKEFNLKGGDKAMYLVTYHYTGYGSSGQQMFGTAFAENVESAVASWQKHEDGVYVLINAQPVSREFADKWDGSLMGQ